MTPDGDRPDPPKISAGITLRIHEGELVMAISDGEGNITLVRQDGADPVEDDAAKGGEVPGSSHRVEGSAAGEPHVPSHEVEPEGVEPHGEHAAPEERDGEPDHGAHPNT